MFLTLTRTLQHITLHLNPKFSIFGRFFSTFISYLFPCCSNNNPPSLLNSHLHQINNIPFYTILSHLKKLPLKTYHTLLFQSPSPPRPRINSFSVLFHVSSKKNKAHMTKRANMLVYQHF